MRHDESGAVLHAKRELTFASCIHDPIPQHESTITAYEVPAFKLLDNLWVGIFAVWAN